MPPSFAPHHLAHAEDSDDDSELGDLAVSSSGENDSEKPGTMDYVIYDGDKEVTGSLAYGQSTYYTNDSGSYTIVNPYVPQTTDIVYQYKKLDRLYTDLELMELSDSLDDNRTMNEIVSRLLNGRGYVYDYINENWEKI